MRTPNRRGWGRCNRTGKGRLRSNPDEPAIPGARSQRRSRRPAKPSRSSPTGPLRYARPKLAIRQAASQCSETQHAARFCRSIFHPRRNKTACLGEKQSLRLSESGHTTRVSCRRDTRQPHNALRLPTRMHVRTAVSPSSSLFATPPIHQGRHAATIVPTHDSCLSPPERPPPP